MRIRHFMKFLGVVWLFSTIGFPADYLENQKFMNLGDASKKFGTTSFSASAFKAGSTTERAKMAVSLIRSRKYIGKGANEVKEDLGPFTGYFWSDGIPAYFIEEGWSHGGDSWQLVFLLADNGKVNEVRIHKNKK